MQKLIHRQTQEVPINYRHSWDSPVFSAQANSIVNLIKVRNSADHKLVCEYANLCGGFRHLSPVGFNQFLDRRASHVVRKQHL